MGRVLEHYDVGYIANDYGEQAIYIGAAVSKMGQKPASKKSRASSPKNRSS
jgi:hypothetical protein